MRDGVQVFRLDHTGTPSPVVMPCAPGSYTVSTEAINVANQAAGQSQPNAPAVRHA